MRRLFGSSERGSRRLEALARAAGRISSQLSIAVVLGLAVAALLRIGGGVAPAPVQQGSPAPAPPPAGGVKSVRAGPAPIPLAAPRSDPAPPAAADPPPASLLHPAAPRSRERDPKAPPRRAESGAFGKAGSAPVPSAGKTPVAPADPKTAAPPAQPPPPDEWSDREIIAALKDCLRRLAPLGARIAIAEPIRKERCGAAAPVVLRRIGSGDDAVVFQPPATLNCATVASLHEWVEETLQPAARQLLGSPIARIRNASGYACRNRVGTVFGSDRLSEHAKANAIDIMSFVTADGRRINVLNQWGPTLHDLRRQQEKAAEIAEEAKAAARVAEEKAAEAARAARTARGAEQAGAKAEAARAREEADRKLEAARQKEAEWRKSQTRIAVLQKVGYGNDAGNGRPPRAQRRGKKKGSSRVPIPEEAEEEDRLPAEAVFLRRLHRGACGTFSTVLGPDANAAHRNHFHFDLATRRRRATYCQ
jgi:hypothetical protein